MPPDFPTDMAWSRQFIPALKRIMAQHLIVEAPFTEDAEHNTDLIVLGLDKLRVACRVRRHDYVNRYADEFTIRSDRPRGTETELAKLISGLGDYFIYGFADATGSSLCAWMLSDLSVFRLWFARQTVALKQMPGLEQRNGDGTRFRAFRINELPGSFLKARVPFHDLGMAA